LALIPVCDDPRARSVAGKEDSGGNLGRGLDRSTGSGYRRERGREFRVLFFDTPGWTQPIPLVHAHTRLVQLDTRPKAQ
jgi:hypothetical protein